MIKLSDVPPVVSPLNSWLRTGSDPDRNLTFFIPLEELWAGPCCEGDDGTVTGRTELLALLLAREVVGVASTAAVVERNTPSSLRIKAPPWQRGAGGGGAGGVGGGGGGGGGGGVAVLLVRAGAWLQVLAAGDLCLSLAGPVLAGVGAVLD